jgi:ABC-2 type transport system ATP-binding protein
MIAATGVCTRARGRQSGLTNINVVIREDERIALLGVSGSGKSTLVRVLLGLDVPDSGAVVWSGRRPPRVSFAGENPLLPIGLRVAEYLELAIACSESSNSSQLVQRCVAALELEPLLCQFTQTLRSEAAVRVSLAFAFLCDAPVVALDEPFMLLEPATRSLMRDLMTWSVYNSHVPRTLLMTTQFTEDIRPPVSRVIIMQAGSIVRDVRLSDIEPLLHSCIFRLPADATPMHAATIVAERGGTPAVVTFARGKLRGRKCVIVGPFRDVSCREMMWSRWD